MHIHKISSRDILDCYLAIGISKESNQESKYQAKILNHINENCEWRASSSGVTMASALYKMGNTDTSAYVCSYIGSSYDLSKQ